MGSNQGQNGNPTGRLLAATSPTEASTPTARRARPCMSEGKLPHSRMKLMELLQSPKSLPLVPDARSLKRAETLASEWKQFYQTASVEEKEIAFPSMVRFVDRLCSFSYSANDPMHGSQLISLLDALAYSETKYALNQLLHISKTHPDENTSLMAISCLESKFGLMLSTPGRSSFDIIWKVLEIYEKQPTHLDRISAQEFAKTASSFTFAHKEYLVKNGYRNLLPYGIAWGTGISIKERIKFMEEVADANDESFKTTVLSRVILLAQSFPCGSPSRFEAPPISRIIEKFPEIARVEENKRQIAEAVEYWGIKRLVETAVSLLGYSGKQLFYIVSPSGELN